MKKEQISYTSILIAILVASCVWLWGYLLFHFFTWQGSEKMMVKQYTGSYLKQKDSYQDGQEAGSESEAPDMVQTDEDVTFVSEEKNSSLAVEEGEIAEEEEEQAVPAEPAVAEEEIKDAMKNMIDTVTAQKTQEGELDDLNQNEIYMKVVPLAKERLIEETEVSEEEVNKVFYREFAGLVENIYQAYMDYLLEDRPQLSHDQQHLTAKQNTAELLKTTPEKIEDVLSYSFNLSIAKNYREESERLKNTMSRELKSMSQEDIEGKIAPLAAKNVAKEMSISPERVREAVDSFK